MECPACGHDIVEKLKKPTRTKQHDDRDAWCPKCGCRFTTRECIVVVFVKDPESLTMMPVPICDFGPYRDFVNGRSLHPRHRNRIE